MRFNSTAKAPFQLTARKKGYYNPPMEGHEENLRIFRYGETVLAQKATEVSRVDQQLTDLIARMWPTMLEARGIGLAAPQIGESLRLAIVDLSEDLPKEGHLLLINPVILEQEGRAMGEEGCLSLPEVYLKVERNTRIVVRYLDLDGREFTREFRDFPARVIQHELDHLEGRVIVDRVSPLKRQLARKQIDKLKRDGRW